MKSIPISLDPSQGEERRVAAVADYALVGTPPEDEFDHIVRLTTSLFEVPIGLISIVDRDEQFFKSKTGIDVCGTARDISFCTHALNMAEPLVIEDAATDARFANNPLVTGAPFIRFYAGAKLVNADGMALGTLCIIDRKPRTFDSKDRERLKALAQIVMDRIELRHVERKLRTNKARLRNLAHYDQLTGLPNRILFLEKLTEYFGTDGVRRPGTLLLLNIDDFKAFNDTLGHATGDQLLVAAAQRLKEAVPKDAVLARLGADEFAAFVTGEQGLFDTSWVGTCMTDCFQQPFVLESTASACLEASLGIAQAPQHGDSAEELLSAANLAVGNAKAMGGRTTRWFTLDLKRDASGRNQLQVELRRAFERNEFELFYQPQVTLTDGKICGAEALLRWRHPEHGYLSPGAFLPVLDKMALAAPVGEWALKTAIKQTANWHQAGLESFRIGVNLFAAQFQVGNLSEVVERVLRETGFAADRLELEVTETIALQNEKTIQTTLQTVRRLGVGIAFDDFGTGFASLSLLKRFPITRLKVDQTFVRDMVTDSEDKAVVKAVLDLGKSFGMEVIAEGIETEHQASILRSMGCLEGQGYLFAKPLPAGEFTEMVIAAVSRASGFQEAV